MIEELFVLSNRAERSALIQGLFVIFAFAFVAWRDWTLYLAGSSTKLFGSLTFMKIMTATCCEAVRWPVKSTVTHFMCEFKCIQHLYVSRSCNKSHNEKAPKTIMKPLEKKWCDKDKIQRSINNATMFIALYDAISRRDNRARPSMIQRDELRRDMVRWVSSLSHNFFLQ